jgi:hypothetical protein
MSTVATIKSVATIHNPVTVILQSGSFEVAVTDVVQNISNKNRNEAAKKKNLPFVQGARIGLLPVFRHSRARLVSTADYIGLVIRLM